MQKLRDWLNDLEGKILITFIDKSDDFMLWWIKKAGCSQEQWARYAEMHSKRLKADREYEEIINE